MPKKAFPDFIPPMMAEKRQSGIRFRRIGSLKLSWMVTERLQSSTKLANRTFGQEIACA
jgi:hypothetical protein